MVRTLNIVFILAVVIGAATVYDMKLAATKSAEKVADLKRHRRGARLHPSSEGGVEPSQQAGPAAVPCLAL